MVWTQRGRHLLAAASAFHGLVPAASAQIRADVYASGLSAPLAFVQDPSDAAVQYIVEQGGRIRVVSNGVLQAADFLNLTSQLGTGGERGLLGLAFPPGYATSGRFYVNFTNTAGHTVVARFNRSSGNPLVADPSTRFDVWTEHTAELGGSASLGLISSFGVDATGELYVVSLTLGRVLRLSAAASGETDTDHDGLPDSWEMQYGLNPNSLSDVNADPDGDGFSNLQEYQRARTRSGPISGRTCWI